MSCCQYMAAKTKSASKLLSRSVANKLLQKAAANEHLPISCFQLLLPTRRCPFSERYEHVAHKSLAGFQHLLERAPHVSLVGKMDDDLTINTNTLRSKFNRKCAKSVF
jgi:hypothetical protein